MVTNWNLSGVRWREFSLAEMMWVVHISTLQQMKEDSPGQVRRYLTQMKDYTALRDWDKEQMKEAST